MKFGEKIVEGIFLERPNRYLAKVEIDGRKTLAHVPDPGRLPGLLIAGRKIRLVYQPSDKRKTDYTLVLVDTVPFGCRYSPLSPILWYPMRCWNNLFLFLKAIPALRVKLKREIVDSTSDWVFPGSLHMWR